MNNTQPPLPEASSLSSLKMKCKMKSPKERYELLHLMEEEWLHTWKMYEGQLKRREKLMDESKDDILLKQRLACMETRLQDLNAKIDMMIDIEIEFRGGMKYDTTKGKLCCCREKITWN